MWSIPVFRSPRCRLGIPALMMTVFGLYAFPVVVEIDDHPETCPSQRLVKIFAAKGWGRYEKPVHGNIAILEIGFEVLKRHCPQFGAWLARIERVGE